MAHSCENCGWRAYAERKPDSFWARVWRWHTKWCPGWRKYQASLREADSRGPSTQDARVK